MQLLKSQHLFLDSSKGSQVSDKPWCWTACLEPGLVKCGQGEYLTVTLERFNTVADWDLVPPGTSFTVTAADETGGPAYSAEVSLPRGNPRLAKVAEAVSADLASIGCSCMYDVSSNRFVFSSPFGLQLQFGDLQVAKLMGFDSLAVGPSSTIQSAQPIRPLPIDTIAVHLLGVNPISGGFNCTNISPGTNVTPCHILGVIPVTASPYTMLDWQNGSSAFTIVLADKSITSLSFLITDWAGTPLQNVGQHYLTLRVNTVRSSPALS